MSEQERNKELDNLVDALLSEYSDVQPPFGLETRLLANLRAAQSGGNHRVWHWLMAGAGAVAIFAAVLVIYVAQIPPLPELPTIRAAGLPTFPPTAARAGNVAPHSAHPHRESSLAKTLDIRQEIFPTPTPLSQGERLLFRYIAATPKEQIAALGSSDGEAEEFREPLGPQPRQFTGTDGQSIR